MTLTTLFTNTHTHLWHTHTQHIHTHTKKSLFTMTLYAFTYSARFSFQRWTKDLKNLWNICEFCTLEKKRKKKFQRLKKNASMDVLYSAWTLDMSVCFSTFSWLFVFVFFWVLGFFWGVVGMGFGFLGTKGSTFSTCNDICYKGLRTEKA